MNRESLYVDKLPEQLHDWQVALIAALEQLQFLYLHFEVSLVSAIDLLSNHKWPALEALAVHSDIPADDAWLKHPNCLKLAIFIAQKAVFPKLVHFNFNDVFTSTDFSAHVRNAFHYRL